MADNKGSSSNPTKGLVSHLDRNRNLQQDRIVASSSSPGISFRSRPQNHSAAPAEANFTNFTATTQLGALPLRPANQQPPVFRPELGRTWRNEYNRSSEREIQDPRIMSSPTRTGAQAAATQRAVNLAELVDAQGPVSQNTLNRLANIRSTSGGYHMGPNFWAPLRTNQLGPHLNAGFVQGVAPGLYNTGPVDQLDPDAQTHAEFERVRGAFQQHMGNVAGANPVADQYNVYPEQVLADNPGLAMEAAFAAYDQDFQNAMDDWMGAHGPEDRVDHVQNMEDALAADELRDELGQPIVGRTEFGPSINPVIPGSNIDVYEQDKKQSLSGKAPEESHNMTWKERVLKQDLPQDAEMREHAVQILDTLASESSAETKQKLKSSSFRGLMEAIATGKAVVHGESFIDSTTGVMIQDWEALGDRSIQNDKGKGKMKSLEEQAQEKQDTDGGPPASA